MTQYAGPSPSAVLKLLKRPWLHFLLLGSCLFLLLRWLNPPALPVVGPLAPARIENLQRQWYGIAGRAVDPMQLERLVRAELDRDMLFQEALRLEIHRYDAVVRQRLIRNMRFLRMGEDRTDQELYRDALRMELHLGDEVVKRRLIQAMEQLLTAGSVIPRPTEEDLQRRFEEQAAALRHPPRYSFEHVYLNWDRAHEAAALLEQIRARQWNAPRARQQGSPFLPGYRFNSLSPQQVARYFGADFVNGLQQSQPRAQTWLGPVRSTYGLHLVWMEEVEAARDALLEEVREQLERGMLLERRQLALRSAIDRLRQHYQVVL